MASVYFDPAVGGNGTTVSDDANPSTGLANGGHRTRFVPALAQTVAVAANTVTKAQEAAASASSALNAPGTNATSTTSLTIGTGSRSFTLAQTGKAFSVGQSVIIANTASPSNWMAGAITAFDSGTGAITVNVLLTNGSGTATTWTISLTAPIPSGTWPITAQNVADGAVTTQKLATDSVTSDKIAAGAVGSSEIADGAVGTAELANDSVTADKIAANAVGTSEIANSAVTAAKLASGAAVSNIGFTPVQQGTGTGQSTNTIKIGWNNAGSLLLEVDSTNFGANWEMNSRNGSRAWVNFNGTGTIAIRASHNVSSITDNGTGDYTVNFATAMVDANFATVGLSKEDESNSVGGTLFFRLARFAQTSSSVRVVAATAADGRIDPIQASIAVFR